ncbi:MAG: hypothetical protein QOE09_2011 [Ilumatobacteraceae bacterium]|jgi:uncharacterized protein (TIGR03086 family)
MAELDLKPAAEQMARLLEGVPDDALDSPTPCPRYCLRDLIGHIGGFALAFKAAAEKDLGDMTSQPPAVRETVLEPDWRERIVRDLDALAAAWQTPAAWQGMTQAGGVDLPGEIAGRVVLDELVVHGWDIAMASGQPYHSDDTMLREVEATVRQFRGENQGDVPGLFGPVVEVSPESSPLERLLGLTGRDPSWSPS